VSAYTTIKTRIASAEHLKRTLLDMGFGEVELHETKQPLTGWRNDAREQSAEIIIRREHVGPTSNDIGFARDEEGCFVALVSEFDRARYNEAWLQSVVQGYAYHVIQDKLAEQDFSVVEQTTDADRTIRITLRRMT